MRRDENYEYLKNSDNRESVFGRFCKNEAKNENDRRV